MHITVFGPRTTSRGACINPWPLQKRLLKHSAPKALFFTSSSYRIDGNKLIVSIDASWNESWNGTQVTRYWQLDGKRLTITSEKAPYSRDPTKMAVGRFVLEKIE